MSDKALSRISLVISVITAVILFLQYQKQKKLWELQQELHREQLDQIKAKK